MMDFIVSCDRRWQRNKVARMAEGDSIPGSTTESTDLNETAKCERTWGVHVGVVRYEYRLSLPFVLPRLQMQVEDFCSTGESSLVAAVGILISAWNPQRTTNKRTGVVLVDEIIASESSTEESISPGPVCACSHCASFSCAKAVV